MINSPVRSRRTIGRRKGGVYVAVLGSAMIIALLGMCALIGQRIENRLVVASSDIRQAQLNANTAVELALLAIKQDTSWRTTYSSGTFFTGRSTGNGTCSASAVDPVDGNISSGADDPIVITGIGYSGGAQQRLQVTLDPKKSPYTCLRSAISTGGTITLSSDILRTNGLTTANQISATSSQVYGKVEATSVSGSTYNGTATTVTADKRPTMPDWTSVFSYYRTNGTSIDINTLPTWSSINLARNAGIESSISSADWFVGPAGSTASIDTGGGIQHSGSKSMRVRSRSDQYAGPAQPIDAYVKMGQQYYIEAYVYHSSSLLNLGIIPLSKTFRISLYTKGTSASNPSINSVDVNANGLQWTKISGYIVAPLWSANLEYAYIKFACTDENVDFWLDDVVIRETTSGRIIYQKALGPGNNPFGGGTNSEGIYKIDCGGQTLIIERSRIVGTLLVINPGAGSCINNGPINWKPAVAGYPVLLVDADTPTSADFSILATNRALSEKENGVSFNPSGVPSTDFGTDTDTNEIFRSQIHGLVAIRHDLTYQNRSLIKGQIIVGNNIANSSGELEIDYQPDSLLNPPPGFWSYSYTRRPMSTQKVVLP
jgi:Carbohydrate binding domain